MDERWQYDWEAFITTLAEHLEKAGSQNRFNQYLLGKTVAWEGILDDKSIDNLAPTVGIGMPTKIIHLGVNQPAVVDGVSLPIANDSIDLWNALEVGCQVKFTATLGSEASIFPPIEVINLRTGESIVMIRLSDGRPIR